MFIHILLFSIIILAVYLPYKGKKLSSISVLQTLGYCALFGTGIGLLFWLGNLGWYMFFPPWALLLFFVISITWFVLSYILPISFHPKIIFLKPPVCFVKYLEILFQQAMSVYIFFVIFPSMNLPTRILWYTIVIALIHAGNFFFLEKRWALFYLFLSIPMGIAFGIFMSFQLVIITASMHFLFYIFLDVLKAAKEKRGMK